MPAYVTNTQNFETASKCAWHSIEGIHYPRYYAWDIRTYVQEEGYL